MKIAICGPFEFSDNPKIYFGGYLQHGDPCDVPFRIEVSMKQSSRSRWAFVFDEESMEYGRGFCRWLSYRSRNDLRVTTFTIEIDNECKGALGVAHLFFNSTSFNPAVPWHLPEGMQVAETKLTLEPSRDLLHFPQSLKEWAITEYHQGQVEKSLDLSLSALQALSEFDDCLVVWDQSRDPLLSIWKQLSYDVLTDILQVYLYQKSPEKAASTPFGRLMSMSFDDDIPPTSKIRFLSLYARFCTETGEIDQAFRPAAAARHPGPTQQR
jgi:hypothetical protein